MSRQYAYFDDAGLKEQLQKSAVSAYCDGGAIEASPCANALAIASAILKDESRTSVFFERLYTRTVVAVQAELNVAYAKEFQKLRKRAFAMDPPKQLVLNFARSHVELTVKYMLQSAASPTLSKGLQIDLSMPQELAPWFKFDDLAEVRQWLDRNGAQRNQIKNVAPAVDLIKSLHQSGGEPLLKVTR